MPIFRVVGENPSVRHAFAGCHFAFEKRAGFARSRGRVPIQGGLQTLQLDARVTCACPDARVFRARHWPVQSVPRELRTIHHVAGGQ
jgi:hypothetical protein